MWDEFYNGDPTPAYGRKVVSLERPPHVNEEVTINFESGPSLKLELEGDCCSKSFFTDLGQFEELIGSTITNIEQRDNEKRTVQLEEDEWVHDSVQNWHFLIFTTDKGHVTIDWRNDSNGYYDGWVKFRWPEEK